MSEYGCVASTRTFEETKALYNTEMTGVFSGGLVYEYSEEGNGFGLGTISGSSYAPGDDFTALKSAFAAQTNPSGNGGATSTSASTTCPTASTEWDVSSNALPAIPAAAEKLMASGAGTGPGIDGAGSQSSGDDDTESTGTATAGSGSVTETASSSSTSKSAGSALVAPFDMRIFGVGFVTILSMFVGMAML